MKSKKLILLLALFMSQVLVFAQNTTLPPINQNPPNPQIESDGFGSVATPVDMYVYVLAIVAILMIAFFAKKFKTQKI